MSANLPMHSHTVESIPLREWLASIELRYCQRREKSVLIEVSHRGPLRVQRPFYPEPDGTCHTYLLHPPGGMAVGDQLNISARLDANTSVLFTTPSAGKMYGTKGVDNAENTPQIQTVNLYCSESTNCEWLPQETIIFNGAKAKIDTHIHLEQHATFVGWDILRLGRAASGEQFNEGYCQQRLQCYRKGKLMFRECNLLEAQSECMQAKWGIQAANTLATLVATVELNRDQIDELYTIVQVDDVPTWGLTQKRDVFIARYLGSSILACRSGLQKIWHYLRPIALNKKACEPRIWST